MATDLSKLNQQQRAAIMASMDKNVVLLAGAGSGKTKTMVTRVQYLIDDMGVDPYSILMVTFTNKAAGEIKKRVANVTDKAGSMWIGTFHSICTKIMRMHGKCMGLDKFTIMDTKDSKALIKEILEDFGMDSSPYIVNDALNKISYYKANVRKPDSVLMDPKETYGSVYREYQNRSWKRKTFDFDDLILYTLLLITTKPEVAEWLHNRFKYVQADECQDTSLSQFALLTNFAGDNNIMMVGDVNQSIYAFRNAKPEYLENFANTHPNTIKMKLEQNYRSTKTIINAANAVVEHNTFGTKVEMFCDNEKGCPIQLYDTIDPYMEAKWVASEISFAGGDYGRFAIIYRANYQSRVIEEELTKAGIPYTIFGATSFYGRKEVRDLLAWLKLSINRHDEYAIRRVLSTLKGIGEKKIEAVVEEGNKNGNDYVTACRTVGNTVRSAQGMIIVAEVLDKFHGSCFDTIKDVIDLTDYRSSMVALGTVEAAERVSIVDEFIEMLRTITNENKLSVEETIDQIELLSETKGEEKANLNAVKLMTAHASKGLEFDTVFIVGAEEGTFPHSNSINTGNPADIEEERRLFYVAMTRAEKKLYITRSRQRKQNFSGITQVTSKSRFINEIPTVLTEETF